MLDASAAADDCSELLECNTVEEVAPENKKSWLDPEVVKKKAAGRSCGICGTVGHLSYACPDAQKPGAKSAAKASDEGRRRAKREKDKDKRRERTQRRAEDRHRMFATMNKSEREQWFTAKEEKRKLQEAKARAAVDRPGNMRVVIDCSYETNMDPRELRSFGQQCSLIYWAMRSAKQPCALHFCSYQGQVRDQLEKVKASNWEGVRLHEGSVAEVFAGDISSR
jgi:hypothetical protein